MLKKDYVTFINGFQLASVSTVKARRILPFLLGVVVFTYSMSNMASYVLSESDTFMYLAVGS